LTAAVTQGEESDSTASLRGQLSSLQGLLVLAMRMTETGDEQSILHLATTAVPALSLCRLQGVHLTGAGWRATAGPGDRAEVRADLETQFAVLSGAGGPVAILQEAWAWAFSLRAIEGHFGFLVVSAPQEPPPSQQFLLRVLAQQTGVALANARRCARERATAAELKLANSALAGTVHALEQSMAIHERLTRVAMATEGEAGIAHALTSSPGTRWRSRTGAVTCVPGRGPTARRPTRWRRMSTASRCSGGRSPRPGRSATATAC
jgi:hypothetical protein